MRVFLIHGMGRSPVSMVSLARRLRRAGHQPSSYGYVVTRRSLQQIADDFVRHVQRVLGKDDAHDRSYAVVGHSLGNVITRVALPALPTGLCRLVMLAPPNQSPALARRMVKRSALFRVLTRDAGAKLADRDFYAQLPRPQVPTLVLAGETNAPWLPHRGRPSDGIVAVEETRLEGAEHQVFDVPHSFIMNQPEVVEAVLAFLHVGSE